MMMMVNYLCQEDCLNCPSVCLLLATVHKTVDRIFMKILPQKYL